ncbi:hypothetical protein M3J09_011883 [Ascochyta lentis]
MAKRYYSMCEVTLRVDRIVLVSKLGFRNGALMRGMWIEQIEDRDIHTGLEEAVTIQTGNRR